MKRIFALLLCLMLLPIPTVVNTMCVAVIVVTTLYSGGEYLIQNKDVFSNMK